ncbi:flagellar hook-length control protein FliK [Roseateles sp. P5_E7]
MLAQNIAPKPAALPPPAQPSLPASSAGGPSFAQFLTDQTAPPPPQTDPEPSPPEDAAEPEQAASAAATPRRATAQTAKPAAQSRAAEGTAKTDVKATLAGKADAQAATDAVTADEDEAADTPELKEFTQLIGLHAAAPEATAAAAKPDSHRGRAAAAADDAPQVRPALSALTTAPANDDRAADKPEAAAAKPGDLRADKSTGRASTESLQVTASQAGSDPSGTAPAPAPPSFAAVLAQALPTPTTLPDAAAAATYANVQAPLHGPAFAPELGARVSLMAVDGVQHAELQLNPADMGPVTVQIVVDGSQAQVSFHALQAETRQALEQSLPDLAAALQGQGLTLSGGGVFQQAPRDADHAEDSRDAGGMARSSRASNDRVGGTAPVAAAPARRSVGLLDTFA